MASAQAQTFTSANLNYTQDFNSLPSSGTAVWADNVTLPGWLSSQTTLQTGTGSSATGSLYSFGSSASADRALGSVASGSAAPVYGVVLTNNSGTPISSLTVTYTGEQWRNGGNATQQKLSFSYSTGTAITLASAATTVAGLDFTGPIATATAAALDGNLAANRITLTQVITFSTPVANGEQILLRWTDVNDAGSDHGLAVDDLSVTAALTIPPATLVVNPATLSGFAATQGQVSAPQVYTLTGSNLTANASLSASAGIEVSTDGSIFSTTATVPQTSSAISQTIAVRLSNTASVGTVNGTVTNESGSASATVTVSGNVTAPTPGKIVISQVYGGGGNTSAPLRNDFIELFNAGGTAVNVTGWSTQYASATATSWVSTTLAGTIAPGSYYLVQQAPGSNTAAAGLPAPDAIGNIAMSGTAGKVALVNSSSPLSGTCPLGSNVIDFVGFGTTANCFEGSGPTTAPSNTSAVLRASNGCTDTNNNAADFSAGAPNPRNSASPTNLCAPPSTPFITATPSPVSLSYTVGSGPASQVVTVNAGNLSPAAGNVTISSSSTAVTTTPTTLTYAGGALNGATFTAQLVAGLPVGSYPATLTLTNGTTSTTLAVNGTVSNTVAVGAPTLISSIQGSGSTAALTGLRTVEGIVTRVFTGSAALNSFYVQEEDSDSDNNPATSEAIAIFDPNGSFTGNSGDKVRVNGTVGEFTTTSGGVNSSLTQMTLTAGTSLTVLSTGNTLPTATTVTLPVTSIADLERYESMLVVVKAASGNLTVTDNFTLGRFGQVLLAATDPATNQPGTDPRIEQYTQFNLPSASGYAAYQAAVAKRVIILDDASGVANPPQIIHARGGNPLSATNTLRTGDDVASVTGILDERFDGYRIQTNVGVNFNATNPRLNAPAAVGGTMKVMGLNVLNYFTDLDSNPANNNPIVTPPNGGGVSFEPRGAETAEEFTRQRDKIIAAITAASPDILGVIEMENNGNTAIGNLVDGLNAATAPGTYTYVNDANLVNDPNSAPGAVGTDAIKVGLIYKPASVSAVGLPMSSSSAAFDRPPVAQTFFEKSTGAKFSVIVNHFKSKGSGSGANADQNDGQGASNASRVAQANALISFVPSVTAAAGDPDVLMLGDYNAYALEDPIRTLATAGFNSIRPNDDYSYAFGGQFGFLDYAFANASLATQVSGSTDWHINSDEPIILDYNTNFKQNQPASLYNADPFRASDHDAVVVGLILTPSLSATLVASTSVCAGSPASFSLTVAGLGTGATYSYTITNGTNSTTASGVSASMVQTSVIPTVAGSFTATVLTSTNASTTAASGNVAINALPTNASLTSGTLTCTNTSVTLTASASGGSSYTLNGGPTSQSNTTGQFVVSTAGNYTAIIANASGCTATATATVVSNTAAPTNASLTSGTLTCAQTSVTLTASAMGASSYTLSDGQTNSTGQFTVSMAGSYTAVIANASGCTATATASVVSNTTAPANPTLSASNSGTLTCSVTSLTLTAATTSSGSFTYAFAGPSGLVGAAGSSNMAAVSAPGVYTVTITGANGCSATATTEVFSNTTAPANASLTSGTLTCTNTSVTLTASATGGASYTLLGGASSQSNATGQFVVSTAGNYTAIIANASGCTATATATVTSSTVAPTATLTASSMTACAPANITLTAGGSGTSFTFSAGATQIGTSNQAIVTQSGTYSVTVSNANGCTATASVSVTVNTPPAAPTLTSASRTVTQSNTPLPLGQFVQATGSNTLSFSGVNGAIANPPTANISMAGVQSFSVSQTDANGCVSAATTFTITVQPGTPTTPGSQTVCRSSSVVLNATATGVRYEWYKNGQSAPFKLTEIASIQKGTTTSSLTLVSIQTTANYYVKVFQANGSFSFEGPFQVVVNYGCIAPGGRVAAAEVAEVPLSVVLTPNPVVDGQLRAVVRGAAGMALSVELVDLNGQLIRQQQWQAADAEQVIEWNMGQQPAGLYLLRLQTDNQRVTTKVMKP